MGFFSKIFGGLKSAGRKIFDVAKSGGRKVLDMASTAKNAVNDVWNKAKDIPVLGGVLNKLEDLPPAKIIQNVGTGIDIANALASGDYSQALKNAQNLKLKEGGIVNEDMMRSKLRIPSLRGPDPNRSRGMPKFDTYGMPVMNYR